ncbi:MAG: ABC transporter substrate-binding protein, partial [Clostridia bacterium]|nr:ABC transporter substrate-binding protein [Clostridia bacterium]
SNVLLADTGAGKTINTELLISYKPDFVICSADIDAQLKAAELLNNAGIACARFRVETFTDYMRMLKICTDITGDSDAYQKYGIDIKNEIDGLLSTVDTNYKNEKILFIRAGSSEKSAKAKTSAEHFACTMLDELGTYNIAENAPLLLDGLSIEEIVIQNPEYIFISTMGDEQAARANMERIINRPEWQSLDAVKNGRYYYLPKDLFQYKPNARWAEAYAYLAEILNEQDTH